MIVDLNNTSDYDKQIIYLDSRNAIFPNKNEFSFNIKFDEKIKNLTSVKLCIKILPSVTVKEVS